MKPILALLLGIFACNPGLGSDRVADLGLGLHYFRPRAAASLEKMHLEGTCTTRILDLRGKEGSYGDAKTTGDWIKKYARPSRPVIVLVNRTTSPILIAYLPAQAISGYLRLGPKSCLDTVDLPVDCDDAIDNSFIAKIDEGSPLEALVALQPDKDRLDEARLSKEHSEGLRDPLSGTTTIAHPKKIAPELDLVLTRAIQIHRSLLALGRLVTP